MAIIKVVISACEIQEELLDVFQAALAGKIDCDFIRESQFEAVNETAEDVVLFVLKGDK